jgi:hypothetical protein
MKTKLIVSLILSVIISSCATLPTQENPDLPSQEISAKAPLNTYRVLFFNDSGFLNRMDGADELRISVDDKYMGTTYQKEFLQLFLKKGTYKINLIHFDVFTFRSEYFINVDSDLYIEASPTPLSNKLEIFKEIPNEFEKNFKASYF